MLMRLDTRGRSWSHLPSHFANSLSPSHHAFTHLVFLFCTYSHQQIKESLTSPRDLALPQQGLITPCASFPPPLSHYNYSIFQSQAGDGCTFNVFLCIAMDFGFAPNRRSRAPCLCRFVTEQSQSMAWWPPSQRI